MPIQLILLLAFIVIAVVVGGMALIANAQRRAVLSRAGVGEDGETSSVIVLRPVRRPGVARSAAVACRDVPRAHV